MLCNWIPDDNGFLLLPWSCVPSVCSYRRDRA